ncbi:MAG TPA: cytochrome c [Solirubrobacteraceae bacterium]|nr:cytochrome c [Solirubrobacteraceae bacterium]
MLRFACAAAIAAVGLGACAGEQRPVRVACATIVGVVGGVNTGSVHVTRQWCLQHELHGPSLAGRALPAAVRAGGEEDVREFEGGERAVSRFGCLACHKIGVDGNPGPGENLTAAGRRLTERQILGALAAGHAPMPSFRNTPAATRRQIAYFLSQLR